MWNQEWFQDQSFQTWCKNSAENCNTTGHRSSCHCTCHHQASLICIKIICRGETWSWKTQLIISYPKFIWNKMQWLLPNVHIKYQVHHIHIPDNCCHPKFSSDFHSDKNIKILVVLKKNNGSLLFPFLQQVITKSGTVNSHGCLCFPFSFHLHPHCLLALSFLSFLQHPCKKSLLL